MVGAIAGAALAYDASWTSFSLAPAAVPGRAGTVRAEEVGLGGARRVAKGAVVEESDESDDETPAATPRGASPPMRKAAAADGEGPC